MNLARVIKISRPRFWLYEAGTFSIGTLVAGFALNLSLPEIFSNPNVLIYLVYFLVFANILIYGVNDIFDYETDSKNPKKGTYEALVQPKEHKSLYYWIFLSNLPFLIYAFFIGWKIALALIVFMFFAIFYSALPIRAKIIPILDSFFSASHYVWTAFFGYYLIGGQGFSISAFVVGILWAMAMHAYSAVPDIEADRDVGMNTVATLLGKKRTIWLCLFLYLVAFIICIKFQIFNYWAIVIFCALYLNIMYVSLKKEGEKLFSLYKLFPYLNAIFGAFIWWSMALSL